jgi:predicted MFS family arabinose efflux permease
LDPAHRRTITLLSCAAFVSAASLRICDPLLPALAREFDTSVGHAAQVISGFAIAYGLMQIVYGPLGDRIGKVRLVAYATLACMAGGAGVIATTSIGAMIAFRVLTGATAAAIIPMSMAWIGDNIEYGERQPILARFLTGQIVGFAGGQLIGGVFADTLGWRWGFAALVVACLVVGLLILREVRRRPELDRHARQVDTHVLVQVLDVLRLPWARTVVAIVFLEGMALFGVLAFVPSDLHVRFGIPLTAAGAILGCYGLGGLVYATFAGQLVRRLGEAGLASVGGALLSASLVALLWANSWMWAVPACILVGLGYYMIHNTLQINATQMAPAARGTAVSVFASLFFLGQSAGVALAALLVDRRGAGAVYASAAVLLPLLAFTLSALLRRRHAARL